MEYSLFSKIPFSKAEDVYASIQLGENAESGSLFEPSRCQMSFPITDDSYTKYIACIACIDLVDKKIVYLDANLRANVSSALRNSSILSEQMPAFFEYLESLPSVHDLFSVCDRAVGTPILYSDAEYSIKNGELAYVFQKHNKNNVISDIDLNKILSA